MEDKLASIERRYKELTAQLADPDLASDYARYVELARQHSELEPIVQKYALGSRRGRSSPRTRRLQRATMNLQRSPARKPKACANASRSSSRSCGSCCCRKTRATSAM